MKSDMLIKKTGFEALKEKLDEKMQKAPPSGELATPQGVA